MKLTAILLTAFCLNVAATGHTQGITLKLKNAPLERVFTEIKKQTGYSFVYNNNLVATAKKVDLQVSSASIEEVLDKCFKDQPLTYTIVEKTIIVKPKEDKSPNDHGVIPGPDPESFPPIDVTGKVTDADGNPLSGATVKVKGTSKGTTTNNDGVFVLKGVDENATLEISFVGYETYTVAVANKTSIAASLKVKPENLNEVIINKGYYTERQRTSVSNVGHVSSKDIEKQPINNALLSMQGRVPGIFIEQANGLPGTGVKIRIQGENSLRKGNDPLFVIDGVPYTSQLLPNLGSILGASGSNQNGNPLSFLNPDDIESIDILKDASATAIYGSRGGNGVVLITTKKGVAGRPRVNVNIQTGWGKVADHLEVLNISQYLQMRKEALRMDGVTTPRANDYDLNGFWDSTHVTDWQKELIGGTTKYNDVQASISGGNSSVHYLIGAGYHKETTVFPGDFSDQKNSVHFAISNNSKDQKLGIDLSGNYLIDNNHLSNTDFTVDAVRLAPNAPGLYNPDGSLNWMNIASGFNSWNNPLRRLSNPYKNKTTNLIANALLTYRILPSLQVRSSFGYNDLQSNEKQLIALEYYAPWLRPNVQRGTLFGENAINSWIIEPQANFSHKLAAGKLDAFIGMTFQQNKANGQQLTAKGFNSNAVMEDIKAASTIEVNSTVNTVYKYNAIYGRINYSWIDKFFIDATLRRDGSSRFGSKNQFHNFGAIGGAWVFSNEKIFSSKLSFISFGKLKASYGTTGSDQIGDYQFLNLYNAVNFGAPYQNTTGLAPTGLPNPYLQWEQTNKLQIGVDMGFLKDKIFVSGYFYRNQSSNQLLAHPLPIVTGFTSLADNLDATLRNWGWELTLGTSNIKIGKVEWSANSNITIPKNKLVSFPDLQKSGWSNSFFIGEPTTIYLAYKFVGVDPSTGIYQFYDGKGGLTSRPDTATSSRIAHINTSPKFYGGLQNTFRVSSFQLDILFQFVKQRAGNYYFGFLPGYFSGGLSNQPTTVINHWSKPGDNYQIQKYNSTGSLSTQYNSAISSDRAFSDASYIRLKNISLSWQLPKNLLTKIHLQAVSLYVQGQNLATITKYKGLDPETKSSTTLPPLRVITTGIKISL